MIKRLLLAVVGLLIAAGGLYAAWAGFVVLEDVRGLDNDLYQKRSEMAYKKASKETVDKTVADYDKKIDRKKTEGNLWLGAGVAGLVVGLGMAVGALVVGHGRAPASPAPAPKQDAPGL
jgi:hypothetical protein